VIALGAAAISIGLKTYFGRQLPLILLGPAMGGNQIGRVGGLVGNASVITL